MNGTCAMMRNIWITVTHLIDFFENICKNIKNMSFTFSCYHMYAELFRFFLSSLINSCGQF